jgi:hypothetical protein
MILKGEGQATAISMDNMLLMVADAPELTWQRTAHEAAAGITSSIECLERVELLVYRGSELAGVAIACLDDDMHVGHCLTVQWRFVFPAHRHSSVIMELQRAVVYLARKVGAGVVAFTHSAQG